MTLPASFLIETLDEKLVMEGEVIESKLIPPDVARHLKSRRIGRNEEVEFINGRGLRARARCEDPISLRYRVVEKKIESVFLPIIELCVPVVKQDLLTETITQATEIGVSKIQWLKCDHDQVPKNLKKPPSDRTTRVSKAAAEQCSRTWGMEISETRETIDALAADLEFTHIVADESLLLEGKIGFHGHTSVPKFLPKIRLYIGPEGGWSDRERQSFDSQNMIRLSLGSFILRVPTAVVAASFFLREQFQRSISEP
jgi:16S rRNA (uracil1498-N3)-methyltransferase